MVWRRWWISEEWVHHRGSQDDEALGASRAPLLCGRDPQFLEYRVDRSIVHRCLEPCPTDYVVWGRARVAQAHLSVDSLIEGVSRLEGLEARVVYDEADDIYVRLGEHDYSEWIELSLTQCLVEETCADHSPPDQVTVATFVEGQDLMAEPDRCRGGSGFRSLEDETPQYQVLSCLCPLGGEDIWRIGRDEFTSPAVSEQEGARWVGYVPEFVRVDRDRVGLTECLDRGEPLQIGRASCRGRVGITVVDVLQ